MSHMETCYALIEANAPGIELVPMAQRMNIKDRREDWTGKSDTILRRKLQNRLNQRASRARRKQAEKQQSSQKDFCAADQIRVVCSHDPSRSSSPSIHDPEAPSTSAIVSRPRWPMNLCVPHMILESMTKIRDFQTFQYTPLPSEQKLLTLMHFDLVRALCQCVNVLGYEPNDLYLDLQSPFVDPAYQTPDSPRYASTSIKDVSNLPPVLQPTTLQKVIPHHPEYDFFPFPRYRDNVIRAYANKTINPPELCMDVCYGVGVDPIWTENKEVELNDRVMSGSKTGFIVWSDPWLQSSWEIEEGFARKYDFLFESCDELLASTNYWRELRGDAPLTFWPFNNVGGGNVYEYPESVF